MYTKQARLRSGWTRHFGRKVGGVWLALVIFWAAGCSIFMEANRPTPTNLHKFEVGQSRDSVRQRLGAPDDSVIQTDGTNCESYQLYTKGYGTGGKLELLF